MTNEFSGLIARRLYRIAALEHENHKNLYALPALLCDKSDALSAPENPSVMGITYKNQEFFERHRDCPGGKGLGICD